MATKMIENIKANKEARAAEKAARKAEKAAEKAAKQAAFEALPLDEQEAIKASRTARGALIGLTVAVGVCAAASGAAVLVAAVRDRDTCCDGTGIDAGTGSMAGESLGFASCDSYGFI